MPYKKDFLGKQHALSGQLAIQPIVQAGNRTLLLDEILGNQFALISIQEIPKVLITNFKNRLNGQVFLVGQDFQSDAFADWILAHKMDFIIIRPFDASRLKDLGRVLNTLFGMLS